MFFFLPAAMARNGTPLYMICLWFVGAIALIAVTIAVIGLVIAMQKNDLVTPPSPPSPASAPSEFLLDLSAVEQFASESCDQSPPLKTTVREGECPRFFLGVNKKDPECHLHVNNTFCVDGDALFSGDVIIEGELLANVTAAAQCTSDAQCDDSDACTADSCDRGVCRNVVPDGTCNRDHFCTSNERCNLTTCECASVCDPATCNTFPCQVRTCVDGACVLLHEDVGCCVVDADCDDSDSCTVDTCVSNECRNELPTPPPREVSCSSDGDCDSASAGCNRTSCTCVTGCDPIVCNTFPCEVRACVAGVCTSLHRDVGCCTSNSECEDFNSCTSNICDTDNQCIFRTLATIPGGDPTCSNDAQCGPNEICLSNCRCAPFIPGGGECLDRSECDDDCPCSLDICNKQCACENIPLPGCCTNDTDCEDTNLCHTGFACDTATGLCSFAVKDDDLDGVPCDVDCDDSDATVGASPTWFRDQDGDGDGDPAVRTVACAQPVGFVASATDCDDSDPMVFAGSAVCNVTDLFNYMRLHPPPEERIADQLFGAAVAIHNDTAIVTAPGATNEAETSSPTRVYVRAFDNVWLEQDRLEPDIPTNDTGFGEFRGSAAIFGDLVVVGFRLNESAFIFERSGSSWTQLDIVRGDATTANFFGASVDVQGDRVAAGSLGDNTTALFAGAAYVFDRNLTTDTWSGSFQKLTAALGAAGHVLGVSVALDRSDGDTLAVGASGSDVNRGQVHIFVNNGTAFQEEGTDVLPLVASDRASFDAFGQSVSLESGVLVVGSPFATVDGESLAGAVYVFVDNGTAFVETQKLVSPDRTASDRCGIDVSISGDTIVVGCPGDGTTAEPSTGSINVYKRSLGSYVWIGKFFPAEIETTVGFGDSVAVDANNIVGGSPESTVLETEDGSAFITSCTPIRTC